MNDLLAAAEARARAVRQRTDRPRNRAQPPGFNLRIADLNESGDTVHFTGLASAYGVPYEMWDAFGPYLEIVEPGAGARSLARPDLDVTLNIGHDQTRRIASTRNGTLFLRETRSGLEVDAPLLDMNDPDVAYIVPKLRSNLTTEMSFAFQIMAGTWSDDATVYHLTEYDLHRGDVAIVGYGANPHTSAQLRSGRDLISEEELIPFRYV